MSDEQRFDLLILGGGMSYVGAIRAAQLGMSVGLVERDRLGGTCLNRGCIPSKAMLETADFLHRVTKQGAEFGLVGGEAVTLDYPALGARRDAVVEKHVKGVEFLLKKNKVTVLHGQGTLTGPTSVRVSGGESGDVEASGTDLILATGSAPRSLPGLEIDGERIITSDEALKRETLPARAAIVGAGAIGVEWASLYRDLGVQVHLVEFADRIVPLEDPDVSKELTRVFKKSGMSVYPASTIVPDSIEHTKTGVHFAIASNDGGDARRDRDRPDHGRHRPPPPDRWDRPGSDRRPGAGSRLRQGRRVHAHRRAAPVRHRRHRAGLRAGPRRRHEAVVAVETIAGHDPAPVRMELMPRVTFCRPADRIGRDERGGRRRRRPDGEGRLLPLPRARQGDDHRRGRRLRQARGRCRDRACCWGRTSSAPRRATCCRSRRWRSCVEGTAAEIAMSVHAHPTLPEVLVEAALAVDGAAIHV